MSEARNFGSARADARELQLNGLTSRAGDPDAWNMYWTCSLKTAVLGGRFHFVVHVEELEHVLVDMGQMPNRAVVEIVAPGGRGQTGRGGAGECGRHDLRGRPAFPVSRDSTPARSAPCLFLVRTGRGP